MSRSLGHKARNKKQSVESSPQGEGRRAFFAGVPQEANPYGIGSGKGKGNAWLRGWRRARMEAAPSQQGEG